jgi:hypothetical protein
MSYNSKYKGAEIDALLDKIKNGGGGSDKTAVVHHGTEDTTFEMTPNVVHKWDVISSLTLTIPDDEEGYVNQYKAVFITASDAFSLALPSSFRWVNDEVPAFEANRQYEISIEGQRILWAKFKAEMPAGDLLEYIDSDGNDYILTDIYINGKFYGVSCKSAPLFKSPADGYVGIAGTMNGTSTGVTPFALWYRSSNRRLDWNGGSQTVSGYANGVENEVTKEGAQITLVATYPLVVFGTNTAGTPSYYNEKMRLYHLKFFGADGKEIVDLRPFRRKSDGAIGLVDFVSMSFYPSVNGNLVGV